MNSNTKPVSSNAFVNANEIFKGIPFRVQQVSPHEKNDYMNLYLTNQSPEAVNFTMEVAKEVFFTSVSASQNKGSIYRIVHNGANQYVQADPRSNVGSS